MAKRLALSLVVVSSLVVSACSSRSDPTESLPSPEDQGTAEAALPAWYPEPGTKQPGMHHQRYRRSEFPADKTFFQWWYFAVKDTVDNRYFAITYSMLDGAENQSKDAARILFAETTPRERTAFQKIETFPLGGFAVEKDFDVRVSSAQVSELPLHRIDAIDDDTVRIRGRMLLSGDAVEVEGRLEGVEATPATTVEWDLTLHRIYGWFGQSQGEWAVKALQTIGWNTYSHSSEVEGTIRVGNRTFTLERGTRWRAYGDQNWGIELPRGLETEEAIDYPWGWYHVGVPGAKPGDELSIIAGVGRQHHTSQGIIEGKFADVRLGQGRDIQLGEAEVLKPTPEAPGRRMFNSTDGDVLKFHVDRSEWTVLQDKWGQARVPLRQQVTLETEHYLIEMDYQSRPEEYNRLVFQHERYRFSDFEALGVRVHTVVRAKAHRDAPPGDVLLDFWSDDGGLEYGYQL